MGTTTEDFINRGPANPRFIRDQFPEIICTIHSCVKKRVWLLTLSKLPCKKD